MSYTHRRHHPVIAVLSILFILFVTLVQSGVLVKKISAPELAPGLYNIDHFVDGDTIAINLDGKVETVRLIGIDTPETHKPNTPVQCYGPQAASYIKQLIGNSGVRIASDPQDSDRDRYGRLVRYVYLPDGRLVEAELIKQGYGFVYTLFPFQKSGELTQDMNVARNAHLGLWEVCQIHQEANGVYQTNDSM